MFNIITQNLQGKRKNGNKNRSVESQFDWQRFLNYFEDTNQFVTERCERKIIKIIHRFC